MKFAHICGANISQRSYFTCPQGQISLKKSTHLSGRQMCAFFWWNRRVGKKKQLRTVFLKPKPPKARSWQSRAGAGERQRLCGGGGEPSIPEPPPLSFLREGGWLFHLRKIENIEKVCHSKNYDRPQMVEPTGISAPYKVSAGNGAECFAPEFARIFCEDNERLQISLKQSESAKQVQFLCRIPPKRKKSREQKALCFSLVEPTGIEPVSKSLLI